MNNGNDERSSSYEQLSSSLSLSDLTDLPDEMRSEIVDIITKKVQEEIRFGNIDPNEIGEDGKTIIQRLADMNNFAIHPNN